MKKLNLMTVILMAIIFTSCATTYEASLESHISSLEDGLATLNKIMYPTKPTKEKKPYTLKKLMKMSADDLYDKAKECHFYKSEISLGPNAIYIMDSENLVFDNDGTFEYYTYTVEDNILTTSFNEELGKYITFSKTDKSATIVFDIENTIYKINLELLR